MHYATIKMLYCSSKYSLFINNILLSYFNIEIEVHFKSKSTQSLAHMLNIIIKIIESKPKFSQINILSLPRKLITIQLYAFQK